MRLVLLSTLVAVSLVKSATGSCSASSGYGRYSNFCSGAGATRCPSPYCKRTGGNNGWNGGNNNSGGTQCKDTYSGDCSKYLWACKSADWFKSQCKKTCGVCGGGGSNSNPNPPKPSPPSSNPSTPSGQCGRKPASIVGGSVATPYSLPWQVALVRRGSNHPFCGGTLIGPRHILTAAHCISGSSIDIIVGEHRISSSSDGTRHSVCRGVNHPQYSKSSQNNDFSILHLSTPVQMGTRATPACLPPTSMGGDYFVGKTMIVSGWGTLSSGGSQPDVLHRVGVPGITNSQCKKSYRNLSSNMLCAGRTSGGVDSCQGDSGGPLTYTTGGRTYIVGVVSFGIGCAKPGYPGVYARVTEQLNWINSELNKRC